MKRLFSLFLCLALVLGVLPMPVFAASPSETDAIRAAVAKQGFDTTSMKLITLLGAAALNPFSWSSEFSLEFTAPNPCGHDRSGSTYRWESDGSGLKAVNGEGLTVNPADLTVMENDNNQPKTFYTLSDTIHLSHSRPWAIEYRVKGSTVLTFGPGTEGHSSQASDDPDAFTTIYHVGNRVHAKNIYWEVLPYQGVNATRIVDDRYEATFPGALTRQMTTYRLENRIAPDGSNTVYLLADGVEQGPLTYHSLRHFDVNKGEYVTDVISESDNWANGTDLRITTIFDRFRGIDPNLEIEYIQIWEGGDTQYFTDYTTEAACTETGKAVRECHWCGAVIKRDIAPALGHSEEPVPAVAVTCTADGLTEGKKCTTCGEFTVPQQVIKAPGHQWDDGIVTTPPTEQAEGVTTYTCTVCGQSRTEPMDKLPHTPVTDPAVEPTCTTDGKTEGSHCSGCGAVLTPQEVIPALGHDWDAGMVTTRPAAGENGVRTHTCKRCGEHKETAILYEAPTRIAGKGRCETAMVAARLLKTTQNVEKFTFVILANGDNFADALAGSYLAAVRNAPILLYRESAMADTLAFLQNTLSDNGTVYLLGGKSAVPESVELLLDEAGIDWERKSGKSRFDTNLEILKEATVPENSEILVATAYNFADSLSASATGKPILLVDSKTGTLTQAQMDWLEDLESPRLTILGGTSAVSEALEALLGEYGEVRRIAGRSRYETSVLIAEEYFPDSLTVVTASAKNFPDGLSGGPVAYALGAPLLLTASGNESAAAAFVNEQKITRAYIMGGQGAVPDGAVKNIFG